MNKVLPYFLVSSLVAALVWLLLFWQPAAMDADKRQTVDLATRPKGGDFTLMSAGGPVSLADFRGKLVMLYFGYTWCPDVCPTSLGFISASLRQLSDAERRHVQVLFISVDPERDSPQRLEEYTSFFDQNMLGLTGEPAVLAEVAARYGAAYRKVAAHQSASGYSVDHSSITYLIDIQGHLRQSLAHATPPDDITTELRALLQE